MKFSDLIPLMAVAAVLILVIGGYIRICIKLRKGGGSLTTIGLGATYEWMTKERRKASETILNMNAGKKQEDPHTKESK